MTCSQTREYLFAFLDNELDAPLSIELQRHLDGCSSCAREAEIERTISKRLSAAMEAAGGELPSLDDLDEPLGTTFAGDEHPLRTVGPLSAHKTINRRRILAAAAVALLVGVGGWRFLKSRSGGGAFADLVAADFQHFLDEGRVLQIASADRSQVAQWLRSKTSLAVVLPADTRFRLIGGRKCKIHGRPAAFAVYELNGVPASLVVITAEKGELEGLKEIHRRGASYRAGRRGHYTVVACRSGELAYAAVSSLAEDELSALVLGAVHESD